MCVLCAVNMLNNEHECVITRIWRERVSTTSTSWKSLRSCRTAQLRDEPPPTSVSSWHRCVCLMEGMEMCVSVFCRLCYIHMDLEGRRHFMSDTTEWKDGETKHAWRCVAMVISYCLQRMEWNIFNSIILSLLLHVTNLVLHIAEKCIFLLIFYHKLKWKVKLSASFWLVTTSLFFCGILITIIMLPLV